MKIKTITLLTGAACLASVLALTSCGSDDLKSVDFKSYSTEITKEAFLEKISSVGSKSDLTGYTITQYNGEKQETTGSVKGSYIDTTERVTKFNKNDNKYYKSTTRYENATSDEGFEKRDTKSEGQYQKNGDKFVSVDITNKTYYEYDFDVEDYTSIYLSNYTYNSAANYANNDGVKFYCDSDVYTAVYNKEESNETTEDGIKVSASSKIEVVYQFYMSDSEFFVKSKITREEKSSTTKDGKTTEYNTTYSSVSDITISFSAPSIDTIDLAKYEEEFSYYFYS